MFFCVLFVFWFIFCLCLICFLSMICVWPYFYVFFVLFSVSHWLQVCTRFGIGNCLTQGGRPTHVSHMLQISHTCFALCVTYVSIIFHLCFDCVPHIFFIYVSHMFHIRITYVSFMFHICFYLRLDIVYVYVMPRPPSIETIPGAPLEQAK